MPKEDKLKSLESALSQLDKQFGKGTVMKLGDKPQVACDVINTGSLLLDEALGIGGLPKGRIIEIYGPESCLFEQTTIDYDLKDDKQKLVNHRGNTIKDLYEQFNCEIDDGVNYSVLAFYIKSINEKNEIITQVIADVIKCGKKECFYVTTENGKNIISTKDHQFYIGNGEYNKLENLKVNDTVYIREDNKIKEDKIISIDLYGEEETYDIKCFAPYNNYIANDIVVHNCGKTTLTLHMIAEAQKAGGIAGFIDAEHAMDPVYAKNIGVDIDNLYISQPDSGEQALEIVETFVRSGAMDIIVVDSVAALVPKKELEGEMGDSNVGLQARLN